MFHFIRYFENWFDKMWEVKNVWTNSSPVNQLTKKKDAFTSYDWDLAGNTCSKLTIETLE